MSDVAASSQAGLDELRALVTAFEATDECLKIENSIRQRLLADDRSLVRFLNANDGHVSKAHEHVVDTARWYAREEPHRLSCRVIEQHFAQGKNYHNGFDRQGRPIVYMRMSRDLPGDDTGKAKIMLYNLERSLRLLEQAGTDADKVVWIVDCAGFSYLRNTNIALAAEVRDIVAYRYAERLGHLFLLNAPWTFRTFWAAISRFLHKTTVAKVHFAAGDAARRLLLEHIDESVLERCYGGENDFEYNHDTYFQQLLAEDAERCVREPDGDVVSTSAKDSVSSPPHGDDLV